MIEELLTAAEIAEKLGVPPGAILGWHKLGRIPARRLPNKALRFSLPDVVAALVARLRRKGVKP